MNTPDRSHHLTHDELYTAVVDAADLLDDQRAHLQACPECDKAFAELNSRLMRLGQMAAAMAPKPAHAFRLPEPRGASARWTFKPVWAMGLAAALLLAITVMQPQWLTGPDKPEVATFDSASDQRLMEAVAALVDNALPADYQQLAALTEPDPVDESDTDDDLLDWIVPIEPDEADTASDDSLT